MSLAFPTLSPLTRSNLISRHLAGDLSESAGTDRDYIACVHAYRCPTCADLHEERSEALHCCASYRKRKRQDKRGAMAGSATPTRPTRMCPVCGEGHDSLHDAVECCLWHDCSIDQRAAITQRLEAGAGWAEACGIHHTPR